MSRGCGCPDANGGEVTDPERHAEWHQQILPLPRADYATLLATYGRPDVPKRTYIDAQFDRARGIFRSSREPH